MSDFIFMPKTNKKDKINIHKRRNAYSITCSDAEPQYFPSPQAREKDKNRGGNFNLSTRLGRVIVGGRVLFPGWRFMISGDNGCIPGQPGLRDRPR
ncbi:hypothetical protein CDAR_517391 [Caerostris darwini]|uniref:Uncharacterized protein n=1 Tax=Caerostris darwini TaxID=1538125 RepID=A0AAV4SKW9_9ARAC|nr:hypothetical protein CDAR_517391 [Caerostris darwini]